jgi:hypothetical protein
MTTSNEELVRAYLEAHRVHDYDAADAMRHRDWSEEWPQTGERVRGIANDRAIMDNWPGGLPAAEAAHVVGSEDRWVVTASMTIQRIAGNGDTWWADGIATYPDGSKWLAVGLLEIREGRIYRESWFYAPPQEAPAWRAAWVERI